MTDFPRGMKDLDPLLSSAIVHDCRVVLAYERE